MPALTPGPTQSATARSHNGAQSFRGEPRVKNDSAITAADVQNTNLILWGDPASIPSLGKVIGKLRCSGMQDTGDWEAALDAAQHSRPDLSQTR